MIDITNNQVYNFGGDSPSESEQIKTLQLDNKFSFTQEASAMLV